MCDYVMPLFPAQRLVPCERAFEGVLSGYVEALIEANACHNTWTYILLAR